MRRQEDRSLRMVIRRRGIAEPPAARKLGIDDIEPRLHLPQSNQRQYRLRILIRPQLGIGPELVRRGEQAPRKVLKIDCQCFPPVVIRSLISQFLLTRSAIISMPRNDIGKLHCSVRNDPAQLI